MLVTPISNRLEHLFLCQWAKASPSQYALDSGGRYVYSAAASNPGANVAVSFQRDLGSTKGSQMGSTQWMSRVRGVRAIKARRLGIVSVLVSVLAMAAVLALPAAGNARSRVHIFVGQLSSRHLIPGETIGLQVAVPSASWCRLSLTHAGVRSSDSAVRRASSGLGQFTWLTSSNVAHGKWRASVRCADSRQAVERGSAARGAASVSLFALQRHRRDHGPAARRIEIVFPRAAQTPTGKGGGSYPRFGALLIPGSGWLDGHGVNVYSDGGDGADGYYQCVELINRLVTTLHWSPVIYGNANRIYYNASTTYFNKYGNGSGYRPVIGDIVVWGGGYGGYGHVAVVDAISGSLLTVVEQNASPSGYNTYVISSSGYIAPTAYGYYVEGFLHAKADTIGQAPAAPAPSPAPSPTPAPTAPPTSTGSPSPSPSPSPPTSPPPPPPTHAETVGGVTHTWTNYSNAGGTEGPSIPSNETVQVACKVTGFKVADGNTWWYRIASAPWNGTYYASADAFYNDGATSGSLVGTPFVDPNVPNC